MASTRNSNLPADAIAQAYDCLAQHVRRDDRVVVALSGGADSVFLLHVLRDLSLRLGFGLSALHVNHNISPNASSWQLFCEQLCSNSGICLDVRQVTVSRGAEGFEASARKARYSAFAETDAEWLVLAHNREDQVETLLLNLIRGAGVAGASAMPVVRRITSTSGLRLLRPLLDISRSEIVAHLRTIGADWIEDESNDDTTYSRNFLRNRILPQLRERFQSCDTSFVRAATHFSECENLLEHLASIDAMAATRNGRVIASRLATMEGARARNLMRFVMRTQGILAPDSAHLHEIVRQICMAAPDRQVCFRFECKSLYRFRDEVWFVQDAGADTEVAWAGEESLQWCGASLVLRPTEGIGISRMKLAGNKVRISNRRGGERLRPDPRRPRRELKKLLQENDIPPWERERIPLLWCGDQLVWVAGVGIDCAWQCTAGEAGLLPEYHAVLPDP